ncbi:alpha/beta fold hydrolase [Candidatus Protochlamydia phocaeensis]|uniref:alpha/beta fold hydrolase n=1 Tax=Candidatus Protochlamydia phocaeensis TaxID=1414722 RepID=UPI000837BE69|nr:alpha/beta hydrolase [Candidatus Protochlamydia phocaeensis]
MRKSLYCLFILMTSGAFVLVCLFLFMSVELFDPVEQARVKNNKQFWEWPSAYGPLAMHYIEQGEGNDHVLLIHGFRAHTYTWRHLITPLAQAGYHVWAVDLIGYGLSDKPDHVPYDMPFFVEQLEAFMKSHQISQAHIAGNSMGGGLALSLALDHSDLVKSLTLISALGYPLDLPLYLSLSRHLGPLWSPFLGPTVVRSSLRQIVFDAQSVTEEQVEAYCLPYRFPGGTKSTLLTLQQFDKQIFVQLSRRFPQIKQPALIIWGDHDWLVPLKHFEHFKRDFPSAKALLIPNCGHIPQEEYPEIVLSTILPFLQSTK